MVATGSDGAQSSAPSASFTKMSTADVEAIGAHCQMAFCHQLDFLPFKCESCQGKYCLDHRTETAHECPKEGAWAERQIAERQARLGPTTKTTLREPQQCYEPSCKTVVGTALSTDYFCESCRHLYCLRHRYQSSHDCDKLRPARIVPGKTTTEKAVSALDKLKAWGAAKKAHLPLSAGRPQSQAATNRKSLMELKQTAKGDDKIDVAKRIYLHVEAQSDTVTAKIRDGNFFYSQDWSCGKVLDAAAKHLQVQNVNNSSGSEADKLAVFHIEGGRVLQFSEKLGAAVQSGNTLVLLRGVTPYSEP